MLQLVYYCCLKCNYYYYHYHSAQKMRSIFYKQRNSQLTSINKSVYLPPSPSILTTSKSFKLTRFDSFAVTKYHNYKHDLSTFTLHA
jgi:hypothetical protein